MGELVAERTIAVPAETAWAAVCDTLGYARWIEHTLAVLEADGPAAVGVRYRERTKLVGRLGLPTRWHVDALDATARTQVHGGAGLPLTDGLRVAFAVLPTEGPTVACTVRFTLGFRPRLGPLAPLAPAVDAAARRLLRGRHERSLAALERLLLAGAA